MIATDVRMPSEPGVNLAGTLYLPTGHGDGPYPIAVLIQGHGPNGRGGYSEIIKRLTADGIAALEYDKRGIGQSTGTYEEDLERLTADAAAAVAAMRHRSDIVGSRNRRARVVVLDGLSHWFQEGAVTGTADEGSKLGPNLGSPRLVALVGDWLRDTLSSKGGKGMGQVR